MGDKIVKEECFTRLRVKLADVTSDLDQFRKDFEDMCEKRFTSPLHDKEAAALKDFIYACSLFQPKREIRHHERSTIGPWELLKALELAVDRLDRILEN